MSAACVCAVCCVCVAYASSRVMSAVRLTTPAAQDSQAWQRVCQWQENTYVLKKGLETGPIHYMVHVKLLDGVHVRPDGSRVKRWAKEESMHPYQLVVPRIATQDPRYVEAVRSRRCAVVCAIVCGIVCVGLCVRFCVGSCVGLCGVVLFLSSASVSLFW